VNIFVLYPHFVQRYVIAICLYARPLVRHIPVWCQNGETFLRNSIAASYCHHSSQNWRHCDIPTESPITVQVK